MTNGIERAGVATIAVALCVGVLWADWSYVAPAERIATSPLIFIGTAIDVRKESSTDFRWHRADVAVERILIGTLPTPHVAVRTYDPTSLQCAPNDGLLNIAGRRYLWTFYKNTSPLEFASTDGPLVDLGDSKAVHAIAKEVEALLASKSKLKAEGRERLKAALTVLRLR